MSFMSFVPFATKHPEMFDGGSWRSRGIGSAVAAQNAATAVPTGGVVPAAVDKDSMRTAA